MAMSEPQTNRERANRIADQTVKNRDWAGFHGATAQLVLEALDAKDAEAAAEYQRGRDEERAKWQSAHDLVCTGPDS